MARKTNNLLDFIEAGQEFTNLGGTDSDIDAILREFGYDEDIEVVELDEVWDD